MRDCGVGRGDDSSNSQDELCYWGCCIMIVVMIVSELNKRWWERVERDRIKREVCGREGGSRGWLRRGEERLLVIPFNRNKLIFSAWATVQKGTRLGNENYPSFSETMYTSTNTGRWVRDQQPTSDHRNQGKPRFKQESAYHPQEQQQVAKLLSKFISSINKRIQSLS